MADAAYLFTRVEQGRAEAFVSVHGVATLYYVAAKAGRAVGDRAVRSVLRMCDVAPLSHADLEAAFTFGMSDYEDAMHAAAARNVGADYVVTRDLKDFAASPVPAISPGELLRLI